ncbi:MAG: hypothetical protein Q7K03_07070, partial [Dehalococcoidia bacterium]|nr:hypothetical protein [Dehalococcoidia bacterium]
QGQGRGRPVRHPRCRRESWRVQSYRKNHCREATGNPTACWENPLGRPDSNRWGRPLPPEAAGLTR